MKINIKIDCSPEEARKFFGLPDVAPMQERAMEELEKRMTAALESMSAEKMVSDWFGGGASGLEQFQKMMRAMTGQGGSTSGD